MTVSRSPRRVARSSASAPRRAAVSQSPTCWAIIPAQHVYRIRHASSPVREASARPSCAAAAAAARSRVTKTARIVLARPNRSASSDPDSRASRRPWASLAPVVL